MNASIPTYPQPPNTSPYDVAEHLRTPEEIAAYLDAWMEDADDTSGITRALGDIARAKSMNHEDLDTALNRESVCRALSDGGKPSFAAVLKAERGTGGEAARAGNVNSAAQKKDG